MPLNSRASNNLRNFDLPVSYKVNESRPRLRDALNVFSNNGRLETRFGRSLYNTTLLGGSILSMTFFRHANGTRYVLAKVGGTIFSVSSTGAATAIKTGLSTTTKHRGLTWSRGQSSRQIISIESDGLFQFNGTTFTQLGQAVPVSPVLTASATTGTLSAKSYDVYLTYYSSTTGFESNKSVIASVNNGSIRAIQDLTYYAKTSNDTSNLINIAYTTGATAGLEVVTVSGNNISVQIASGVSTALQIKGAVGLSVAASALVTVSITGISSSAQVTAAAAFLQNGRQSILVSSIPTTADNATIDKIRIYLKDTASVDDPVYITELTLGTSSYTISSVGTSTNTAPIANGAPLPGGGKFLAEFNRKLVYAGNATYPNDVIFSEEDLPSAFNDGGADGQLVLSAPFNGEVTGIATGLFNDSILTPYLVVFKKRSTFIYSEIAGEGKFIPISREIGCVSHETIQVKNGDVYFLSDQGWRMISSGRIAADDKNNSATLGLGDIDDIFRQPGYVYEANKLQMQNSFSVYYSTLDQYMTWIAEGSNSDMTKTYVYEFQIGGFKPYSFQSASTCACIGEDSNGAEVVFMADNAGAIYTHSVKEERADDNNLGVDQSIDAFAMLTWLDGDDLDASYNFRELLLKRVSTGNTLTVKTWINYSLNNLSELSFDFGNSLEGFILDVSVLDEGTFGDDRTMIVARADINRSGQNILIGFYQNIIGGNINLINAQIDFNKNGNRN